MRLTKYEPQESSMFPYQLQEDELRNRLTAIHKLGLLEDIEDELGIELLTLIKASKEGFFKTNKFGKLSYINPNKSIDFKNKCILVGSYTKLSFKDYGKTWALTKEELK